VITDPAVAKPANEVIADLGPIVSERFGASASILPRGLGADFS
jgi:hypothetical protein